jgi:hypothetical protein
VDATGDALLERLQRDDQIADWLIVLWRRVRGRCVDRRAVFVMAIGQRPQPWLAYRRGRGSALCLERSRRARSRASGCA